MSGVENSSAGALAVQEPAGSSQAVGFWKRALARVLDTFLLFAFDSGIKYGLAIGFGIAWDRPTGSAAVATYWLISAIGTAAYYVLFELLAGTTFGKLIVGAQVVALDLGPIRPVQAIKRSIAFFVDALFFGMVAAVVMSESPFQQRVGDKWARTRVVRRGALLPALRTPAAPIPIAAIVAVGCSGASTVAMALL